MKNKNDNNVSLCPRCNQVMIATEKFCKSCGFVVENKNELQKTKLQFGKKIATDATFATGSIPNEFRQRKTPIISKIKSIQNYVYLFIGLFSILLLVLPLFNHINVFQQSNNISSIYRFTLSESLKIESADNFFALVGNIISFSKEHNNVVNPSFIVYIYEIIVAVFAFAIIVLGVILSILSTNVIVNNSKNDHFKNFVGYILILSLIMNFGLNCYGIGIILLSILCASCLIFLYISGIISKEKEFMPKQLIFKAICVGLLIANISISSIGLVNLNVDIGAPLYNFGEYPSKGVDNSPIRIATHGIFLEIIQIIQCSSGDEVFTKFTLILNSALCIFHTIYLCFAIFCVVSLLKSLSKQSISFPICRILISTFAFYIFTLLLVFFNQIINEAALDKCINQIGIINYSQLSAAEQLKIEKTYKVFTLRAGLILSTILYLPTCVFTILSNKICLKKNY